MTDALVSPSRTIAIGGAEYRLDGSFATLRAVQEGFNRDLYEILISVMDMRLDEIARLIAIGSGRAAESDAIGQAIVDEAGLGTAYIVLKMEVQAWLTVAVTPKSAREKKSEEMTGIVVSARASLGRNTSGSPSASSPRGGRGRSGKATSGK